MRCARRGSCGSARACRARPWPKAGSSRPETTCPRTSSTSTRPTRWRSRPGSASLIVAPIIGDEGPLGAIEVYRHERHAFDADRRGGPRRAGRPGRDRDHERPADRGAGTLAASGRPARRDRALAARHHRPHRRPARARRHPRSGRRGGQAPARHRRRPPDADVGGRHVPASRSSWPAAPTRRPGPGCSRCSSRSAAASTASPPSSACRSRRSTTSPTRGSRRNPTTSRSPSASACAAMAAAPLRAPGGEVIGTLAVSSAHAARLPAPRSSTSSRASPTRPPSRSRTRRCSRAWANRRSATGSSSRTRRISSGRSGRTPG